MVMYAGMIHLADIKRPGHTLVSRKKQLTETTVATSIECRIQPSADAAAFSVLGRTASESYVGFFPGQTDIRIGDKVVWKDRSDETFIVEGNTDQSSGAYADLDHHVEVSLKRMEVE